MRDRILDTSILNFLNFGRVRTQWLWLQWSGNHNGGLLFFKYICYKNEKGTETNISVRSVVKTLCLSDYFMYTCIPAKCTPHKVEKNAVRLLVVNGFSICSSHAVPPRNDIFCVLPKIDGEKKKPGEKLCPRFIMLMLLY